jgi:hypothetical protein
MRQSCAAHVEVPEDVGTEGAVELLVGDIFDRFLVLLVRSVVNEDVEPAKRLYRLVHRCGTERGILHVARDQQCPTAFVPDGLLGCPRV